MHSFWIIFFAVAAGYTVSGIAASLYRLSGFKEDGKNGKLIRQIVLVIAGPTVLFGTVLRGYAKKEWSLVFFALAVMALSYWSFAIGLFVLDFATVF